MLEYAGSLGHTVIGITEHETVANAIKFEREYAKVKEKYPNLSLGTVYRNIAEFKQDGEVCSVAVVNGIDRIDGDCSPHQHFVCSQCGAVEDLDIGFQTEDISEQISERCGARASKVSLTAYGLCRHCLEK